MSPPPRKRPRVAVVGSLNRDLVVEVERLPAPGETVLGGAVAQLSGGKGANQAVAAARLGADVTLVGRVGDDATGGELVELLRAEQIDVRHVTPTRQCATGLALIQVERSGQNSIVVAPGANGHLTVEDVQRAADDIAQAAVLLVQLEVPLAAVLAAQAIARQAGVPIVLDPAPAPTGWPPELLNVDYLCPNETEAAALVGSRVESLPDAARAAERLHALGARCALVTLGAQGVWVFQAELGHQQFPSPAVTAIDSTAAGDAFASALAVAVATAMPFDEALQWACAAGALTASRRGAQPALPYADEVNRLSGRSQCSN